jgi:hypothetical protein
MQPQTPVFQLLAEPGLGLHGRQQRQAGDLGNLGGPQSAR